jgi:PKD repeat protein
MNNHIPTKFSLFSFALTALFYLLYPSLQAQTPCIDSSLINPNGLCPTVYDPVCGCNGITYGNSCEAQTFGGVTSWTHGECGASCDDLTVQFEGFWQPLTTQISFLNLSGMPGGEIVSRNWSFGDGTDSGEQNPTHTYAAPGEYLVCLNIKATTPGGLVCEKNYCKFIQVPIDCFDNCFYDVAVDLDGVAMRASLTPALTDTPFFFFVLWSLDDGAATGTGLEYFQQVTKPGIHTICASYPTGDFSPEMCTVCKVFEVSATCINPEQIDSIPCPLAFIPVCGCDGVTYGNECEAFNWGGVTSWTPGPCGSICNNLHLDFDGFNSGGSLTVWTFNDQSLFAGGQLTSWFWDFGNGMTSNEQNPTINFGDTGDYEVCLVASGVFADGTQCGSYTCQTVHVANQLCIDPTVIDPNAVCPAIYAPVCGCDGITYENDCVAQFQHGVTSWTPGICPSVCINPAWIDTLQPCIEIYDPVCGCDGQNYDNACFAQTHGVTSWQKGVCCPNQLCRALFSVEIQADRTVLLRDQSINAESWNVTFGDGAAHGGGFDTISHTYNTAGLYQICLEISNFAGTCTDTYCTLVDFSASAVTDPLADTRFTTFPNPTQGILSLQWEGAAPEQVQLLDIFGKKLLEQSLSGNSQQIDLRELPDGVYLLQVQTKNGAAVRKIILHR